MRQLLIWIGPVHSGKSTKACILAERYRRRGADVVLARPSKSVREDEISGDRPGMLVTKTGHKFPSIEFASALDIPDAADGASVLWLDEPFMFTEQERLFEIVQAQRQLRTVLVSTLGATNAMECISDPVARLLMVADRIHHCRADCDFCDGMGRATRSVYVGEAPKTEKVKVGGASAYRAACWRCWSPVSTAVTSAKVSLAD